MVMPAPLPLHPDTSRHDWTVERVNALPDDGNRYEVIDGELLVTPAPSWVHQRAVFKLATRMEAYAELHGLDVLVAPAAVTFSGRREVQPDFFVAPMIGGRYAARFEEVKRLVLAVEVVSPSSARSDRHRKRELYKSEGVPEYWIVDPDARLVERWRPNDERPEILAELLSWAPIEGTAPLVIDLPAYFRRVFGESS